MNQPLVDLIWYFIFYAWLGWILESGYKTVRDRRPVNSGFLSGPLVPIYGFGAIGVIQLLNVVAPMVSSLNPALKIIIELAATTAMASMLELGTGVLLESLFHKRWWDYSDERFNLLGLVSLKYSVLWGGLSFLALNIIQPHMDTIVSIIPINIKIAAMVFLVVYLALDLAGRCIYYTKFSLKNLNLTAPCHPGTAALARPWASHGSLPSWHRRISPSWASHGSLPSWHRRISPSWASNWRIKMNQNWKFFRKLTDEEQYQLYIEYATFVDELVFHPKVQMMKQFRHHQNVSCFEHSLNVSFASYLLCKKLGWDCKSAARGGLLHDLFLYDWRTTDLEEGKHGFVHPRIAYDNAVGEFTLNHREKDIILKHMFPLTWRPPSCKESLLVCAMDKLCALQELLGLNTAADVSMGFEGL